LESIAREDRLIKANMINGKETLEIGTKFRSSRTPLVILDYDGTLIPFHDHPAKASPTEEIHSLLSSFSDQAKVLIISGREHTDLEKWFGNTRADLIAEHGSWYKENRRWVKPRHSAGP